MSPASASSGAPLITGLHHVVLAVADVPGAMHLYGHALGLHERGDGLLYGPNAALRLVAGPAMAPHPLAVNVAGIAHICVQSTQLPELFARWRAAGGGANSEPVDLGTGYRYCYARDLEGHVCELEQLPALPPARWPAGEATWLAHASVAAADFDRLVDFYAALLGRTAVRSPVMGGRPAMDELAALPGVRLQMAWIDAGNQQIEVIHYLHPPTRQESPRRAAGAGGFVQLVFEVGDVPGALARVESAGGRVTDAAAGLATDPEGNAMRFLSGAQLHAEGRALADLPDPFIKARFERARREVI